MVQLLSLILLVLVTSAFCYEDDVKSAAEITEELRRLDTQATEQERITGGTAAEDGQFPYAVALLRNNEYICTASILSPRTILTAAHCLTSKAGEAQSPSAFLGTVGSANRTSKDALNITFEDLVVHEDYNGTTMQNDIALLRTTERIPMSDKIKPVVIASNETRQTDYKRGTVIGWGANDTSQSFPDVLHYRHVLILLHITCQVRYLGHVTEKMICADGGAGGICYGDSGGPMVHISKDTECPHIQIGVASFVRDGCRSGVLSPGVETRVSSYEQWIREKSQDPEIVSMKKRGLHC